MKCTHSSWHKRWLISYMFPFFFAHTHTWDVCVRARVRKRRKMNKQKVEMLYPRFPFYLVCWCVYIKTSSWSLVTANQATNRSLVAQPHVFSRLTHHHHLPGALAHYHSQVDANEKDTTTQQQQHKKIPREPVVVLLLRFSPTGLWLNRDMWKRKLLFQNTRRPTSSLPFFYQKRNP